MFEQYAQSLQQCHLTQCSVATSREVDLRDKVSEFTLEMEQQLKVKVKDSIPLTAVFTCIMQVSVEEKCPPAVELWQLPESVVLSSQLMPRALATISIDEGVN